MAGHSKWHNIQHRKGAQDAKRGKIFTKLIREITVAAKMGDEDTASNPRLRAAIDKALSNNMTRDTINRAVKRGAGGSEAEQLEEIIYEGYGTNGVAVLVECLTDNRNRTVAEVRHAFSKCGGNMGTSGSVAYLFTKQGIISFAPGCDEENIITIALEAEADDVVTNDDGSVDVITSMEKFMPVKDALTEGGLEPAAAEMTMTASMEVELTNQDQVDKLLRLNNLLEDLDDVQNVYTNASIDDSLLGDA